MAQTGLNVLRKNMRHCCTSVCDLQNCGEDQMKPFPAAGKGINNDKSFGKMQWSTGTNLAPTRCSFGGKGWGWPTMGFCGSHKLFFCGDITSTTMVYHHMVVDKLWFIIKIYNLYNYVFYGFSWSFPMFSICVPDGKSHGKKIKKRMTPIHLRRSWKKEAGWRRGSESSREADQLVNKGWCAPYWLCIKKTESMFTLFTSNYNLTV